MSVRFAGAAALAGLFVFLAAGCGGAGPLARWSPGRSAHEAYAESLRAVGLEASALGSTWLSNADAALAMARSVSLPLSEIGYLDPAKPGAIAYRFELPRGRRLGFTVTLESNEPARLFIDLFRVGDGGSDRVASAAAGANELQYVSRSDGTYILRLQPELLRGGRYTVTQRTEASLRFPVKDADERNIQSLFGDARDGGLRDHHGVDIFAPRGTPVIAAAGGTVRSVRETDVGGRVVWLYDNAHGQSLYYAHLDDWAVRDGQHVSAGDVLGYVGNTGNARTTPPHLHFGIYARGPVDPLPFIRASDRTPSPPSGPVGLVGQWARVVRAAAPLRPDPDQNSAPAMTLVAGTALFVRGARSTFFRVTLPDGLEGFVEARALTAAADPLRVARLRQDAPLRERPSSTAVVIRDVDAGSRVPVLGEFSGFLFVELPDGRRGWLPRESS